MNLWQGTDQTVVYPPLLHLDSEIRATSDLFSRFSL